MEQKDVALQVISKASNTVPEDGEMLHDGTAGVVAAVSGPDVGMLYLMKPGTVLPVEIQF